MVFGSVLLLLGSAHAGRPFTANFDSLAGWEPLTFPKIEAHSTYQIESTEAGSFLRTESAASASGLVSEHTLDVHAYPVLQWRWRVENIYENTRVQAKEGDDYPIRIYVLFEYDPDKASFGQRIQYRAARLIYGEYPPHSTLNYVWSSATETPDHYPNPFTSRAQMIPLRRGDSQVGEWVVETVNILDDYRRVFDEDPPRIARIAIMNDSDNTGEAAVSSIDWIQTKEGN